MAKKDKVVTKTYEREICPDKRDPNAPKKIGSLPAGFDDKDKVFIKDGKIYIQHKK